MMGKYLRYFVSETIQTVRLGSFLSDLNFDTRSNCFMLSVEISDYDIEIALTDNRTINFYSQDFRATSVLVLPFFS